MSDDYLEKTIAAYNNAPEKFKCATKDMVNVDEMDNMLHLLPHKQLPILDVGCGYGKDSEALTKRGFKTVGIDMSDRLLNQAHNIYPYLIFKKMDARYLDFADNSFGAAWCNAVLLHLNDKDLKNALAEIYRVLAPKGIIAVSFKEGEGSREVVEKFSSEMARFYNFKTLDELNKILETTGFSVQKDYTFNEKDKFGSDKRDLVWIWSFAVKP